MQTHTTVAYGGVRFVTVAAPELGGRCKTEIHNVLNAPEPSCCACAAKIFATTTQWQYGRQSLFLVCRRTCPPAGCKSIRCRRRATIMCVGSYMDLSDGLQQKYQWCRRMCMTNQAVFSKNSSLG